MLLFKSNAWFLNHLVSPPPVPPTRKFCYVSEVIDLRRGRLILSDGLHFIPATFKGDVFKGDENRMILRKEDLELKGGILMLRKYKIVINKERRVEIQIEECVYVGEGGVAGEMKDVNQQKEIGCVIMNTETEEWSFEACDIENSSDDIEAIIETSMERIVLDTAMERTTMETITQSEAITQSENQKKKPKKEPITESFLLNATELPITQPEEADIAKAVNIGDGLSRFTCSLPSSILERELFSQQSSNQSSQKQCSLDDGFQIVSSNPTQKSRSILSDISNLNTSQNGYVEKAVPDDGCVEKRVSVNANKSKSRVYKDRVDTNHNTSRSHVNTSRSNTNTNRSNTNTNRSSNKQKESINHTFIPESLKAKIIKPQKRKFLLSSIENNRIPVIFVRSAFMNDIFSNKTVIADGLQRISYMKTGRCICADSCSQNYSFLMGSPFTFIKRNSKFNQINPQRFALRLPQPTWNRLFCPDFLLFGTITDENTVLFPGYE